MSHEAALRGARLEFGGIEQMKEASRDMRGTARLESIVRDLRFGVRSLKSRPGCTVTVIATLAFGIGANTAIFTLVDALVLRPLPVPHPEQLVIVSDPTAVNNNNVGSPLTDFVSVPLYRDVRARNTVMDAARFLDARSLVFPTVGGFAGARCREPSARHRYSLTAQIWQAIPNFIFRNRRRATRIASGRTCRVAGGSRSMSRWGSFPTLRGRGWIRRSRPGRSRKAWRSTLRDSGWFANASKHGRVIEGNRSRRARGRDRRTHCASTRQGLAAGPRRRQRWPRDAPAQTTAEDAATLVARAALALKTGRRATDRGRSSPI
jgi:hypothetical protein